MTNIKPTIYPTFVIGLGGTGTNVARYVKRRLLKSWATNELDDLPSVLQVLAVDTEPLVNYPGEEPLYYHEFAFLGKYDATRLVQNRRNHPYLSWWKWNEGDIPLGYIHSGAKQLRPIGRLSFFRHYVTFKNLMVDKLNAMQEHSAIQEAEERGVEVAANHRLIYIVSSLCGGTGAGMFLDVAHRVRQEVGSNAHIMGIFMMPSIFQKEVRSDLQRRRIQANAYAALKELNYFHTTQNFQALYPSEQQPLPTTKYRAFNQIFLLERSSTTGRALGSKSAAEQMAAHLIYLTAFSHLNKRILALDVNVTEERGSGSGNSNKKYLAYSSFGVSALVMPRRALWRYFIHMTTLETMETLLTGEAQQADPNAIWSAYLSMRDEIKNFFLTFDTNQKLNALREDIAHQEGRWLGFVSIVATTAKQALLQGGLRRLEELISRLTLERSEQDQLTRDDLAHENQQPFLELPLARPIRLWERPFLSRDEQGRRQRAARARELYETQSQVWALLIENLRTFARNWGGQISECKHAVDEAAEGAWQDAEDAAKQIHPLHRNRDTETNTYYDLETGAVGNDHVEAYWGSAAALLAEPVSDEEDAPTGWETLLHAIHERLLPDGANRLNVLGSMGLRQAVEQELAADTLAFLREEVAKAFDLRSVVYLQHGSKRPANYRIDQLYQRMAPHAAIDGDTHPYSEADQEHTRLVGTPSQPSEESDDRGRVFRRAMKGYSQFEWVETGDGDRMDACHIVHGLPVGQLESMPEMHRQYHSNEFAPHSMLHVQPEWEQLPEAYQPPANAPTSSATSRTATSPGPLPAGSSPSRRGRGKI